MLLMRRDVDGDEIASAVPKSNSNSAKFSSEASSIQEHHLPPHAAKVAEASSREKMPEIIAIDHCWGSSRARSRFSERTSKFMAGTHSTATRERFRSQCGTRGDFVQFD